jgi:sugar phosphate isomerase/epimerase
LFEVSLSTMWAKGRFSHMAGFVSKAKEFGFTHIEANASISPQMLSELLKTKVPISSIHAPCPATSSSRGIPISSLSLSSLNESDRTEAVRFTKQTIDLASSVRAKAIVLHMGEVPIDLSLQDRLYKLHEGGYSQTKEYNRVKEELVYQRNSQTLHYLDAAKKSLQDISEYSQQKGIILGLETRFHFHEIPNIDEMAELLNKIPRNLVGYWHDVGHAEVQQQLGFSLHKEWVSRFRDRMVGIHLHDVLGIYDHHAPGKGDIDWEMLTKYLPPRIVKVCEIGEWNDEEQVQGVVEFLQNKGVLNWPEELNEFNKHTT